MLFRSRASEQSHYWQEIRREDFLEALRDGKGCASGLVRSASVVVIHLEPLRWIVGSADIERDAIPRVDQRRK